MPKQKKCRECKSEYMPANSMQVVCSPKCALDYSRKQEQKRQQLQAKEKRKQTIKQKEQLKNKHTLTKEAQAAFNAWVRERDFNHGCISCGRSKEEVESEYSRGGHWDAGHFLSRGARPEHRFNPLNVHKQCKSCNGGSGKYSRKGYTVQQEYRLRLIEKIGLDEVEVMECDHKPLNLTHDELRAIRDKYRKETRKLKKQRNI